MKKASDGKDIAGFREVTKLLCFVMLDLANSISKALQIYSKACPEETFETIGKKMRDENFTIHLIGLVGDTHFTRMRQAADWSL